MEPLDRSGASNEAPKSLSREPERAARLALLSSQHVAVLEQIVDRMREAKGPEYKVPHFDPMDGGVDAKVLFLLEAPGPKALVTGFVSRDNPDETAKNFFLLSREARIERRHTLIWNAVPWYIGSGSRIRPAGKGDVREADSWLKELLATLTELRFVVFVGRKALHAQGVVRESRSSVAVMTMPHPSPMFINRAPGNRHRILSVLQELSARLEQTIELNP